MKSGTGYTRTRVDNILPKMLNSLHVRGQKNLDNNNGHALEFLAPCTGMNCWEMELSSPHTWPEAKVDR